MQQQLGRGGTGPGEECGRVQKESKIAREEGCVGEYGWTGRRTARVAHKRAGRRLRLVGDLEHFPMLRGLCVPLRAPVDGSWWRHRATHLVPAWALHPGALQHAVLPVDPLRCTEACTAGGLSAASGAASGAASSAPRQAAPSADAAEA
ncbi:hypothetical protein SVAN01_07315 [Stagonosporopsis vannaccii]|nr:hypothetical protein SVAN01_07315 [Stagonosporopsis vannaccii]